MALRKVHGLMDPQKHFANHSLKTVEGLKHFPRPLKVMKQFPNELWLEIVIKILASYSADTTHSLISGCKFTLATCN